MTGHRHLCDLLSEAAATSPDKPAFVWPDTTLTWSEFAWDVRAVAGALKAMEIQPGDNVAVLLHDLPLHPILAFAAPMIGAVYLPLNPRRSFSDIARLLQKPAPAVVFVSETMREQLNQELHANDLHLRLIGVREDGLITSDDWPRDALPAEDDPVGGEDDVAVRRLTPGVTREVRVVPLTHRSLLSATEAVRKALQVLPSDTLLGAFPFFTSCGHLMQTLLPTWVAGTVHLAGELDPEQTLDKLEHGDITAFMGGAKQFTALQPALRERLARSRDAVPLTDTIVDTADAPNSTEQTAPDAPASGVESVETTGDANVEANDPAATSPASDPQSGDTPATDDASDDEAPQDEVTPVPDSDRDQDDPAEPDKVDPSDDTTDAAERDDSFDTPADSAPAKNGNSLLTADDDNRHLRFALCAGAHADMTVLSEFEESLGCPVATAYGVVEASGIIAINPAHLDASHPGALGKPVSGMHVQIRDDDGTVLLPGRVGEIWVSGPNLFSGYEQHEDEGMRDGWFPTSDIGTLNEDHWLHFVSRLEDRITRGGFSVAPQEVERVLNSSPRVAESAVVGVPDPPMGERLVAFVVPEPNADIEDDPLRAHCAETLPRYKIPTRFIQVDELPRSPNGFIMRRQLREDARTR